MGWPPKKGSGLAGHPSLWADDELPRSTPKLPERNFKSLKFPLWTQNKARLIQEYLRLFRVRDDHGSYIDRFAAPQYETHEDAWAANLVLQMEPKWFTQFWLCDINPVRVDKLRKLKAEHESRKRKIEVLAGDFNLTVADILSAGKIKETTATFVLLDQRTFECEWQTVVALSKHEN